MADRQQLLLHAAGEALQEHQAGKLIPSVEDALHLEKRWDKLPGAHSGSVALQDASAMLGAEVLEGDALELVIQQVAGGVGAPPAALTKRQFLALAHVAEVAQGKAFDLQSAQDALRAPEQPASQKKRPPAIRDAHIDEWHIAAAPADPAPMYEAPTPKAVDCDSSSAEQPAQPAGAQEQGIRPLSTAASLVGNQGAEAEQAGQLYQQYQSGATSYQSMEDVAEQEEAELAPQAPVYVAGSSAMPASPGLDSAAVRGAASEGAGSGKARSSWESFNSSTPGSAGAAAAGQPIRGSSPPGAMPQLAPSSIQPPVAHSVNETVVAAAVAAGMTFMQHMQAAGMAGAASPDANPLRHAAAVAAAAVAANPAAMGRGVTAPSSPELHSAGSRQLHQGHSQQLPQHKIAEMMAQLRLGDGATPAQLQVAAAQLHQQALAMEEQQEYGMQRSMPRAGSSRGSRGSSSATAEIQHRAAYQQRQEQPPQSGRQGSEGSRHSSWRAFDATGQAAAAVSAQQHTPQASQSKANSNKSSASRRQKAAAVVAVDLSPQRARGLAGWEPMSGGDVQRCRDIFVKKGYPAVGGMEKHCAMEYFAKLHMERKIFAQAWHAADMTADGRLDAREFCLFVQLLRGAQKGCAIPPCLTQAEAEGLLGEGPMPRAAAAPIQISGARLGRALSSGRGALPGLERQESVLQGFDHDDDAASSIDSGIAESVSGLSVSSRSSRHPAVGGPHALGRLGTQPSHVRTGLGSVLGGGCGAPSYRAPSERVAAPGGAAGGGAHKLLEVAIHSAEVKYRKALINPIFTLSLRDSLGRLVELPIDTHPGHYRPDKGTIHSSAIVRLTSPLKTIPPGSMLFVELKHYKDDKRRFSTLAWAAVPLDKLVDAGPSTARVRGGPLDLPLLKKPVDASLRKVRRLSRTFDLHLSIRGVE